MKLLTKLIIWIALEVTLNLIGLDDLSDYQEFLLKEYHPVFTPLNNIEIVFQKHL